MLMHYKIIGYRRYVCIDGLNENVKNMASSDRLEYIVMVSKCSVLKIK